MPKLTRMQKKVYDYIVDYIDAQGYPPSVREIAEALGLRSPSTVHFHMTHLEELGLIEKGAGKGRAIVLKSEERAKGAPGAPRAAEPAALPAAWQEEAESRAGRVPVLGNVAAGGPILAQECIEDYITFDTGGRSGEHFALRVRGESMLGLGILPDDLVIVRRQSDANNGEIVVALIGEEATVKTFSRRNGHLWLLPANPDYQPIDGQYAQILGRVVAVLRQY